MRYRLRDHQQHFVRLWSKVDDSGPKTSCYPWTGAVNATGYGILEHDGRRSAVHRVVFVFCEDMDIPAGLYVRHRCENRLCCNPKHLYLARRVGLGDAYEEIPEWKVREWRRRERAGTPKGGPRMKRRA